MSTASSQQLSAVSRQIEQSRDLNRQLLNTIRWEVGKVKAAVERLQGLHGKINEVHAILKRLEAHQYGIQPLSSVVRFREHHSQTPPKSPTNTVSTQSINCNFDDEDGETSFKPDASEVDSQEEFQPDEYELGQAEDHELAQKEREEEEEEETEL